MSKQRPEQEFGSDSFMDVLCNVVGILIILMVLSGLRAGQMPVQLSTAEIPRIEVATAPVAEGVPLALGPAVPLPAAVDPEPEGPPAPPSELVSAAEALQQELAAMGGEYETTVGKMTAAQKQQALLEAKLAAARAAVEQREVEVETEQQKRASTTAELSKLKIIVSQLATQIDQTEAVTPKLQQIEHRITPIGQEITGHELHFQVLHGKVAIIPLEKLIDRLKGQVERRKEWLAKSQKQMGQVGPIDGFSMNYVVERDAMSVVDELHYGQGMFRISVSSWQLKPERDFVAESPAAATQSGSRFYAALLEAGEGAALTFWVYPDSFAAFGELQRFCHAQNFLVAGRPLPEGQPISGSPGGSRSSGQ